MIAAIEFRSDDDPDIRPYVYERCVDMCIVEPSAEIVACRASLVDTIRAIIGRLCNMKVQSLRSEGIHDAAQHLAIQSSGVILRGGLQSSWVLCMSRYRLLAL